MFQDLNSDQVVELTQIIPESGEVSFDGDRTLLEGVYRDQLSAYRAKRVWLEAFSIYFLLDEEQDLRVQISSDHEHGVYLIRCEFLSACARYAFWRLTNHQTPEAQYIIETAHIPQCESQEEQFLRASDLKPVKRSYSPLVLGGDFPHNARSALRKLCDRLLNGFKQEE